MIYLVYSDQAKWNFRCPHAFASKSNVNQFLIYQHAWDNC